MRAPVASQVGGGRDRRSVHHGYDGACIASDFAVAAAAVNLKDAAGSRRRRAVVAPGVGGGAVGACAGVLAR